MIAANKMSKAFILLFFFFSVLVSYAQVNLGLEKRVVRINVHNQPPRQVLSTLGNELGVSVSYNADFLKEGKITIQSDSLQLREVIDSLFFKKNLKFRLIGNQLVVYESVEEALALDTCYQAMEGRLIDGFTEQGLERATIKELYTNQLTVSNKDGKFRINVPCDQDNIQLEISAMGYRSRFISQPVAGEMGPIIMEGDYIALKEVLILSLQADLLLEAVLKKVCDNYVNQPTKATSFFREAILKNNKMVALSEAVFDVYNQSYGTIGKRDLTHLIKGRKFIDHSNIDTVDFKMKGSLRSCLELDVVKQQPYFFNLNSYEDTYQYTFNTIVEYNGRDMYVINFRHRPTAEGLPYEGKMFIDKELKSLVSIEFELNRRSMRKTDDDFVVKKSKNVKTKFQSAYYHVHYTDVDGKLAMNYAYFTNSFKVKKKNSMFSAKYETIGEYVVNKFRMEDVDKIKPRETFPAEKIFMDEPMEYSDSYWRGINFLPINKPLLESSDELQKILSSN